MNIEWKEGAVVFAGNRQWHSNKDVKPYSLVSNMQGTCLETYRGALSFQDFQLNNINRGDYILASELDTEQKFHDAVEVFELFGYSFDPAKAHHQNDFKAIIKSGGGLHLYVSEIGFLRLGFSFDDKGKVTLNQLMAIGELKRMMNERESNNSTEIKSIPITTPIKYNELSEELKDRVKSCGEIIGRSANVKTNSSEEVDLKSSATSEQTKTASDYLNECISVQKERGEQYDPSGTGERSFDAAARAFNALTGGNLKGSDVCLLLTCVKAVRQYSNPNRLHDDSLLDGVSYLSLWAEELNKELK